METIKTIFILFEAIVIWSLLHRIQKKEASGNKNIIKKKRLEDYNKGEKINVHKYGHITCAEVFNNSPAERKMVLTFFFKNDTTTFEVISYNSSEFKDFDILNNIDKISDKDLKRDLTEKLNKYLKEEKFEEAAILRDAISKLSNK